MPTFLENATAAIPAEVHMFSGCMDSQTSADVSDVGNFSLPDTAGKAGGALTSSLLKVCYKDKKKPDADLTYVDVLGQIREVLSDMRFTQVPQLSSSRPTNVGTKFDISPQSHKGTKRAVLIGINYVGQKGELSGCHNDVLNMVDYITEVHGFKAENITILMDDGVNTNPTKANILSAYQKITAESKEGDVVFCHYSGHGGKLKDDNGDEEDGYDETLIPLDYQKAGQIRDDDLLKDLVVPLSKGVFATFIMDCCHSGTVLDLPYVFKADGKQTEMSEESGFPFQAAIAIATSLAAAATSQESAPAMGRLQECCTIS
jgi:hypothetical protein